MSHNRPKYITSGAHRMLNIDWLVPYPDHPFKLYEGERLDNMVRSIKELGIISPIIVRYVKRNKQVFEILSGHNRVNAAKIAGFTEVPVIVNTDLTDDEARLVVTETNLAQRSFSDLSHSERAISLARHYEALKHQGRRSDLLNEIEAYMNPQNTSAETQQKSDSRETIGKNYNLSRDKVAKYIRISTLIPELLDLIDSGKIALNTGYQLSFIDDKDMQNSISGLIYNGYKFDTNTAILLRKRYEDGDLTRMGIEPIVYNNMNRIKPFKLNAEIINSFFNEKQSKAEIEEIIKTALQFYYDSFQSENQAGED